MSWDQLLHIVEPHTLRPSTRYMVMHGIGHGALIRASVKLNGPMPACGDIPHCDESMAALSADFCMLAPRDDYKVQCGDGMYHGVFHHPSVKTLQRTSWAYFCEGQVAQYGPSTYACLVIAAQDFVRGANPRRIAHAINAVGASPAQTANTPYQSILADTILSLRTLCRSSFNAPFHANAKVHQDHHCEHRVDGYRLAVEKA